ncbi:uncharacterized protein METZ01_LOCUS118468 [marine metagenome]|uniref:Uncharacterized protein n=1 Tax=marine metagenome TaxID=408172 RepID=A0A381XLG8_9ZZZZ
MFKMRQAGVANQEIARRFGTSIGAVGKAVNRQLEKLNAEALLAYPEVLRMELERLDQLQSAIWPMTQHRRVTLDDGTDVSVEPDMKAIQQVLSIMDRRSRLLGMEQQNVSVRVQGSTRGPDAIRQVLAGVQELPTATANSPEQEAKKLLALMVKSGVVSSEEVTGALGEDATSSLLSHDDGDDIVDAEIVEETDG